jgi:hypothetical protein
VTGLGVIQQCPEAHGDCFRDLGALRSCDSFGDGAATPSVAWAWPQLSASGHLGLSSTLAVMAGLARKRQHGELAKALPGVLLVRETGSELTPSRFQLRSQPIC